MPDKIVPRGIKSLAANGVVIDREWWLKVGWHAAGGFLVGGDTAGVVPALVLDPGREMLLCNVVEAMTTVDDGGR